jgi:hypothetical protein
MKKIWIPILLCGVSHVVACSASDDTRKEEACPLQQKFLTVPFYFILLRDPWQCTGTIKLNLQVDIPLGTALKDILKNHQQTILKALPGPYPLHYDSCRLQLEFLDAWIPAYRATHSIDTSGSLSAENLFFQERVNADHAFQLTFSIVKKN